jgi:probable HAF family extracellular repeat protein
MNRFSTIAVVIGTAIGAAACAVEAEADGDGAAPELLEQAGSHGRTDYHVIKLHGLGGTASGGNGINNLGWVTGTSTIDEDAATHAMLWVFGIPIDLGTLGAAPTANSAVIWPVKNGRGVISGITEVPGDDPFGEDWSCSAFMAKTPGHVCRGFVWEDGEMRALPTLGGTHGFATGTNNRGQTVGWAENSFEDPTCNRTTQFLQFRAVVWGPDPDQLRELPPLGDDTVSSATAINDKGQVAGISGICSQAVGELSAIHAVIWERDGTITDLGNLGGVAWNTPMAMNDRGEVVGFANAAGTEPPTAFNYRAFRWTRKTGMQDLGTLDGDTRAQALGINERGQVVGLSRGTGFRGFLWEDGVMVDLNQRIASGSRDTIIVAGDINDFGIITGQSVDASGVASAFVAIPTRRR